MLRHEADAVDKEKIRTFLSGDLAARVIASPAVYREKCFTCGVKAGEYFALRLLAAAIGAGLTWAQLRLPPNGMPAAVHAPLPVSALAVAALAVPVLLRLRLNISRRAGVENSASPAPEPPHVVAGFACRTPEVKSVKSKIFA